MTSRQLLEVLRDARELGDKAFEQSVLEQLDVDVAYVEVSSKASAATYRPRFDFGGYEYDDEEPETPDEMRARVSLTARNIERRDWLAWTRAGAWHRRHPSTVGAAASSLTTLAHIYKRVYSDRSIADMASRSAPSFASLTRAGRLESVVMMAQIGLIEPDEARALLELDGEV